MKNYIGNILNRIRDSKWTIGFIDNSIEGVIGEEPLRIKWVECNYKDRWYADPFILDVTESQITLLAEEFYYPIKRARIAKLIIDRDKHQIVSTKPILTLPTHLSYPAIIRKDNNIYIYPESGLSGKLMLYQYHPDTDEVTEERVLINEYVADATYTNLFGEDLIFCTVLPGINENELFVYREDADGVYQRGEKIVFKDNIARMAGDFFKVDGKIYRPAQDCNKSYGNGTVIQEVKRENGQWTFKEIRRYFSDNPQYPLGIHTLNMYKDVIVVDAVGYWRPKAAYITNVLVNAIKTIMGMVRSSLPKKNYMRQSETR